MRRTALIVLVLAALFPATANAAGHAGLSPHIGSQVDLGLVYADETGARQTLGALTAGKPALVLLGYDRCPNLCGLAELDLAQALKATGLPTDRYRVLFASIDPAEEPSDAAAARAKLAAATGDDDLASWRFITGDATSVAALEAAIGITVSDAPGRDQYIHPVAVAAFTPDGRLARVLSGLDYQASDLRLAVVEASQGKLATLIDRIVLLCSAFDPSTGRYSSTIMATLRFASIGIIALLAGGIFLLSRRGGGRAA